MKYLHNKSLTSYSRNNRKAQTNAEDLLWFHLRGRQLAGFKFRRQYPVSNYILDFYCHEKKLAIELDGGQHEKQKVYDEKRSAEIRKYGIRIIRFWDNQVLKGIENVLEKILEVLMQTSP